MTTLLTPDAYMAPLQILEDLVRLAPPGGVVLDPFAGSGTTGVACERLQGAPDGWTDGQSDSARYRQLGNAVAVPVFEWVARRLVDVDAQIRGEVGARCTA